MTTAPQAAQPVGTPRSNFVTVVAWIFMVLSGLAAFITILQNVMIAVVFSMDGVRELAFPTVDPRTGKELPWFFQFFFHHFQLLFLAFLLVAATTFAASVGLLKRKNWARILFIAIMALGIAWNVAGIAMTIPMYSVFSDTMASANQPEFAHQFGIVWKVMAGLNLLVVVALSALFGWIIKRLASASIRREFVPEAIA